MHAGQLMTGKHILKLIVQVPDHEYVGSEGLTAVLKVVLEAIQVSVCYPQMVTSLNFEHITFLKKNMDHHCINKVHDLVNQWKFTYYISH